MKRRGSLSGRSLSRLALILMVSGCSTGPRISPADIQATIPAHLLVRPSDPPKVQRSTDPKSGAASMTGGDAMVSMTDLYAYIGTIRGQLDGLIDAVVARDAKPAAKKHRGLHL